MDTKKITSIINSIIKKNIKAKIYPYGRVKKGLGDKFATGSLYNSINTKVKKTNNDIVFSVSMIKYGKDVDEGTKPGKTVELESLLKWIKVRNLSTGTKFGDTMFGLNIQKNIRKYGIKPAPFIERSINQIMNNPELIQLILNDVKEDLNITFSKTFK
jgi:hypothetical protein